MKHCVGGAAVLTVLLAFLALVGCARHSGQPKVAEPTIEPVILFSAEGLSPKWDELTREIIPKRINRRAKTKLVAYEDIAAPKYKLVLRFVNREKEIVGSKGTGAAMAGPVTPSGPQMLGVAGSKSKIKTKTTVEAEASMRDPKGQIVWKWVGYGEDEDENNAVEQLGDKMGADLAKRGFLDLSRYR